MSTMRFTPPAQTQGRPGGTPASPTTYEWAGPRRRARHGVGLALLTVLAILGVSTVLAAAARLAFDVDVLVVRSGSMAPSMPVGSLVLTRPVSADLVEPGDVISVVRTDGRRVTHRVVAAEGSGALRRLTTQGDANAAPDPEPITAGTVERVMLSAPELGRVLLLRDSTPVQLLAGALCGAAVCWTLGPPTARHIGRWVPLTDRIQGGTS